MSHDQNLKNLILDHPRAALALLAAAEAHDLDPDVRIVPIRQEQLQERLGERFRELDVPLLVEWPDGRRAALLFVLEEESDPRRFSIHRLAHYCLDLAELCATDRIVPVVIFLRAAAGVAEALRLGGDRQRLQYAHDYPDEADTMSRFAERFREEGLQQGMQQGMQQGIQQGVQQGEARLLARQLQLKFGTLPADVLQRLAEADEPTLLAWSERLLTASRLEDVLR
jgi:hypothetical protein